MMCYFIEVRFKKQKVRHAATQAVGQPVKSYDFFIVPTYLTEKLLKSHFIQEQVRNLQVQNFNNVIFELCLSDIILDFVIKPSRLLNLSILIENFK